MKTLKKAFAAVAFLVASTANATLIDFTNDDHWASNGEKTASHTYDSGLEVTITSHPGAFTNKTEGKACSTALTGLMCQTDGLGVRDDEISFGNEYIKVEFSQSVDVDWIAFLDLFIEGPNLNTPELAKVRVNGDENSVFGFEGDQTRNTVGWFQTSGDNFFSGVTMLEFFADANSGDEISPGNTDFALAAINVTEVSEPGTLALMGLGVLALVGARKRIRS
ncbi:MAG: PEP-CTERM sorting domain-containing protein [Oleiphilaceae bacterium]|nr:PEP-CTERM sorting domain-containing protein [Oleiphilaceae bacterium]